MSQKQEIQHFFKSQSPVVFQFVINISVSIQGDGVGEFSASEEKQQVAEDDAAKKIRRASDVIRLGYYSQLCGCDRWQFESVEEEFEFQELFKEEAMHMCISCPQPSNRDFFLLEKQIYEYMLESRKNVKN